MSSFPVKNFELEIERYISDEVEERDVRPLLAAGRELMTSGQMTQSQLGPVSAVLWHAAFDLERSWWGSSGVCGRLLVWLFIAIEKLTYRGRPMWNDFHMGCWMLSRDPRYIQKLYRHLKKANAAQKRTGEWMVKSVSDQDPDFKEHWDDLVSECGPVFDGDLQGFSESAR